MNYFITFFVLAFCFALMAIGLIFAKKVLTKGCSMTPEECLCKKEGKILINGECQREEIDGAEKK